MDKLDKPFQWRTQTGEVLYIHEMATTHLYHSLKMIFNHTAPEHMKLHPYKKWGLVSQWSVPVRRQCVMAFIEELSKRTDRPEYVDIGIKHMIECANNIVYKEYHEPKQIEAK